MQEQKISDNKELDYEELKEKYFKFLGKIEKQLELIAVKKEDLAESLARIVEEINMPGLEFGEPQDHDNTKTDQDPPSVYLGIYFKGKHLVDFDTDLLSAEDVKVVLEDYECV